MFSWAFRQSQLECMSIAFKFSNNKLISSKDFAKILNLNSFVKIVFKEYFSVTNSFDFFSTFADSLHYQQLFM